MDALLLLAPATGSIGYSGRGDFTMAPDGRLQKRGDASLVTLRLCRRRDPVARIVQRHARGRIPAHAAVRPRRQGRPPARLAPEGRWMHVGTPDAIAPAEAAIKAGVC